MKSNIFWVFCLVCFGFLFFHIIIDYLYFTNDVVFAPYIDIYSQTRLNNLIDLREKWYWVSYFIFPIYLSLECFIVSIIIYLGSYFTGYDFDFSKIFKVSLISQIVFLFPELIKLIWFSYNPITLELLREFHPLSLFSLFQPELLEDWLYYPFKVMNFFEVSFWIFLAYLLSKQFNQSFNSMLKLVLFYYVPFLFCWVVFVMFISLGNS